MERDWRMVVRNLPVHSLLYRSISFLCMLTRFMIPCLENLTGSMPSYTDCVLQSRKHQPYVSLYNPCNRNHVGKVFYYLFGTIRGVCCQKWSVNRGGGAKEFCDLKITCQFFSVNNTGEITAQYEAIFARYIITDVFVFVCNENPYLM